jgi:hypothetical protein
VAACSASNGVSPASTSKASSSCRLKPSVRNCLCVSILQ